MRQPTTRHLYSYWNSLRGERAAPERAEIDPAGIRQVLAETFMLEVDENRDFPVRLSGTRLNAFWMSELKGHSFLDLWGEERASISAVLWTVLDGTVPVVMGATAAPAGREPLDLELLLLPLRHHGKTHARILGSIAASSRPRWLGLLPVEKLTLRSLRIVTGKAQDIHLPVFSRRRSLDGFRADSVANTQRVLDGGERRAHLTVYRGGR